MSPLNWWRVCRTCNEYYKESDNIGTWSCAYHPGLYNAEMDGDKFPNIPTSAVELPIHLIETTAVKTLTTIQCFYMVAQIKIMVHCFKF